MTTNTVNNNSPWHYNLRRWHKWLSAIVGIQLLIWTLSGLFMVAVSINDIHGDQFVAPEETLSNTKLVPIPSDYTTARRVVLTQQLSKPVYIIDNRWLLDAQTGNNIPITREYITQRALELFTGNPVIISTNKLTQYPDELGGRHRPIWRVDFDDLFNPSFYFSVNTGQLIRKRSDLWRVYDFLWSLHIMDYQAGEDSHNTLLLIASLVATLMVTSGIWLMIYALRLPTQLGKKGILTAIHRWIGLVISIQLLLWVVSGLIFNLMSSDITKSTLTINRMPIERFTVADIDFNKIIEQHSTAHKVSIIATNSAPLIYLDNGKKPPQTLSLTTQLLSKTQIKNIAQRAITPTLPIDSITLLTGNDTESRQFKRHVWQVKFANEMNSTLYIDAYSGRVLKVIEDAWRLRDFFWMLHIMDYDKRADFNHPLIVAAACLASIASLAGFILLFFSFTRTNRHAKNKQATISITGSSASAIVIATGQSLLNGVNRDKMIIDSGCGGKGTCGQCMVKIDDYNLPLNSQEALTLSDSEIHHGYRLACQTKVTGNLEVTLPTPMRENHYRATVISTRFLTPFIKEITFEVCNNRFIYLAGQSISIAIPPFSAPINTTSLPTILRSAWDADIANPITAHNTTQTQRSYSMADNINSNNQFSLNVKLVLTENNSHVGIGSGYLFSLSDGDNINFSGPSGQFYIDEHSSREIVLIGAGSGIAPLKALAQEAIINEKRRVSLWYGARTPLDIVHHAYFDNLHLTHKNFQWRLSLSQALSSDWPGLTGYIQHHLVSGYLSKHNALDNIDFYLCGPKVMMDDTYQKLLHLGISPQHIKQDFF